MKFGVVEHVQNEKGIERFKFMSFFTCIKSVIPECQ